MSDLFTGLESYIKDSANFLNDYEGGVSINGDPFTPTSDETSMYPHDVCELVNKLDDHKKKQKYFFGNSDTEDDDSEFDNLNSSAVNSERTCPNILTGIYDECIFDVKKFTELTEEQKEVVFTYLEKILTKERLNSLKSFLSQKSINMLNSILLKSTDYCSKKSRIDEVLKLITSQALKKLYHNFMKTNGINKSFNPKKYTKRADINRKIYLHYFKREPINNEHKNLFLIKNGVTREWFEGATGGNKRCSAFVEDLLKILRDDRFFEFYKQKIDSMIRRILGVVEFAEEQEEEELLNNEIEKAKKIKTKLQGGEDPKKAKKPKMPCHRYLFQQCVKDTVNKIEMLASEKQIKLATKSHA